MNRIIMAVILVIGYVFMNVNGLFIGAAAAQGSSSEGEYEVTGNQKNLLHTKWEFYWNELLEPAAIKQSSIPPASISVPSSWKGQVINGHPLPSVGYATYRLQLQVPPDHIGKNRVLYFQRVGSAYEVWIDGQKKDFVGAVGKTVDEETPVQRLNFVFFEPKQEIVDIVIQVSNYSFREGGIVGEVSYDDPETLVPAVSKPFIKDIFIVGGFFFIGLYHLITFGITKQLSILMIGLIGLAGAVRTLFLSEYIVFLLLPGISWELMVRTEYLVEIAAFVSIVLLMKQMYPKEVHHIPLRLAYMYTVLSSFYVLVAPVRVFTETMMLHVTIMASFLVYFVFYVGMMAALRKREGARVSLIALLIVIVSMCNDVLYFTKIVNTVEMMAYSGLLFLLLQAVIMSYRYSLLFNKNKALAAELVNMNATLEEKVMTRTKELQKKNEELFHQATIDGLTGIFNRKHFFSEVRQKLMEAEAGLSLLLLDIDDFKRINDVYGHIAGDQVLIEFAAILKEAYGSEGVIGRVGGEEFAICLTEITEKESIETAERLRLLIQHHEIKLHEQASIFITVSIGIAYTNKKDSRFEKLYHHADVALYTSKESGKNKVTLGENS